MTKKSQKTLKNPLFLSIFALKYPKIDYFNHEYIEKNAQKSHFGPIFKKPKSTIAIDKNGDFCEKNTLKIRIDVMIWSIFFKKRAKIALFFLKFELIEYRKINSLCRQSVS